MDSDLKKYTNVEFLKESQTLVMTYKESTIMMTDVEFRNVKISWLNKITEVRPKNLLIDASKNHYIVGPTMQTWILDVLEAIGNLGVMKLAIILPTSVFPNTSFLQIMEEIKQPSYHIRQHHYKDEAMNWLLRSQMM